MLAACAPAGAPAAGGESAAAPAGERIEVTFSGWGGTEEDEGVRAAITQFESEQETVKVTWLHTPDANEQNTKLLADMAAGTPPDTLDKDFVRRWVAARCDPYVDPIPPLPPEIVLEAARTYVDAYQTLTGRELALPDRTESPLSRIRRNLQPYLGRASS